MIRLDVAAHLTDDLPQLVGRQVTLAEQDGVIAAGRVIAGDLTDLAQQSVDALALEDVSGALFRLEAATPKQHQQHLRQPSARVRIVGPLPTVHEPAMAQLAVPRRVDLHSSRLVAGLLFDLHFAVRR